MSWIEVNLDNNYRCLSKETFFFFVQKLLIMYDLLENN